MPYIREKDFARVRELLETIEELAQKKDKISLTDIRDIAVRALRVMAKYSVERKKEEE